MNIIILVSSVLIFISLDNVGAADVDVLQKLSEALTPKPLGWSDSDPCKWPGIKCGGGKDSRVEGIDISKQNLSGSIDKVDFSQLSQLKTISLQDNQLSGSIPNFSHLTFLQQLFLDQNNFTSVPPKIFSGLASLQVIDVSRNLNLQPWVLPQDLKQSTRLITICASNCKLMGPVPDFIAGFVGLRNLSLSHNNLTGVLPQNLAASSLKNFLVDNQVRCLTGTLEVIGKMTNLEQVWLNENKFTGTIPDLSNWHLATQ